MYQDKECISICSQLMWVVKLWINPWNQSKTSNLSFRWLDFVFIMVTLGVLENIYGDVTTMLPFTISLGYIMPDWAAD